MATFPAFLDTCTLFGAYLCDTLLRLAEAGTFRPLWSAGVLGELERNLVDKRGLGKEAVLYRIGEMRRSFPDAEVRGYEDLTESMTCDAKDRHVLAAAVRGRAEVLVTVNTDDFPYASTAPYDLVVVHPDDFLLDQLDLYPGATEYLGGQRFQALPRLVQHRRGRVEDRDVVTSLGERERLIAGAAPYIEQCGGRRRQVLQQVPVQHVGAYVSLHRCVCLVDEQARQAGACPRIISHHLKILVSE